MRSFLRSLHRVFHGHRQSSSYRPILESLEDRCLLANGFLQTNLVSDIAGVARFTDSHLVNPWGIAFGPTGPFWIADNNAGVSTLYNRAGQAQPSNMPLVVTIPLLPAVQPPRLQRRASSSTQRLISVSR